MKIARLHERPFWHSTLWALGLFEGKDDDDEATLIGALLTKDRRAPRGEIGNRHAVRAHGGALVIGAVDERAEVGGFAVAAADAGLAACLDEAIGRLTDGGRIGYRRWLDDPGVFLRRARMWKGGER